VFLLPRLIKNLPRITDRVDFVQSPVFHLMEIVLNILQPASLLNINDIVTIILPHITKVELK